MKQDLLKIINHYGVSHQLKKLSEEVFELQEAIMIDKNDKYYMVEEIDILEYNKKHIIEEYADVMVLLEQFKAYYELNNDEIIDIMKYKIARTIERMKKSNDNLSK